jgi:hypothetical protein
MQGTFKFSLFDTATALEHAVPFFDAPSQTVATNYFYGLLPGADRQISQKHPFQGFLGRRWIDFSDPDRVKF